MRHAFDRNKPISLALGAAGNEVALRLLSKIEHHFAGRVGKFEMIVARHSLLALLPALAGMFLGQHVRNRLKPEIFRKWFFIALLILGTYMVLRTIPALHT